MYMHNSKINRSLDAHTMWLLHATAAWHISTCTYSHVKHSIFAYAYIALVGLQLHLYVIIRMYN